jgi:hypothetical protein
LADNDNKDLADHPREDKAEGEDKALAPVDPVARGDLEAPVSVLVVLVDRLADLAVPEDQAQNVLVGLISKGQ